MIERHVERILDSFAAWLLATRGKRWFYFSTFYMWLRERFGPAEVMAIKDSVLNSDRIEKLGDSAYKITG